MVNVLGIERQADAIGNGSMSEQTIGSNPNPAANLSPFGGGGN
jgi:hypothetical protein